MTHDEKDMYKIRITKGLFYACNKTEQIENHTMAYLNLVSNLFDTSLMFSRFGGKGYCIHVFGSGCVGVPNECDIFAASYVHGQVSKSFI